MLIVGGEDHKTGKDEDTTERFETLLAFAAARFKVASVQYRSSAQVIEPVDGLPFIGREQGSEHVYVATGYSGTGMTFGTLAAMINTDLILDRKNPYQDLYDPGRFKAKASIVVAIAMPAEQANDHTAQPITLRGVEATPHLEEIGVSL